MREITPHGYQSAAVGTMITRLVQLDNVPQLPHDLVPIIAHSAPTGSGKTITMIHLVEELTQGTQITPRPDMRILWVSDSPQLNLQTMAKFQQFSNVLSANELYVIDDDSFDEEYLLPGAVGFINTQKLSRPGRLLQHDDSRTFTFWETLNNTIRDHFENTLIIIDEAHSGIGRPGAHGTILSQLMSINIDGAILEYTPKTIGISATPQRFLDFCVATGRNPIEVPTLVADVRATGALKDNYVVHSDQAFNAFLNSAVDQLVEFSSNWLQFHNDNPQSKLIHPLLCIQVRNADLENPISATNIDDIVATLNGLDLGFDLEGSIHHCFGDGQTLEFGGIEIPHIDSSRISTRNDVRIVLFKQSIITGWDCPRAEILISDRQTEDYTVVCQLIGRIVRAPLHQRIESNQDLNQIHLYLPNFDEDTVQNVINYLHDVEGLDLTPTVNPVEFQRSENYDDVFALLEGLPTYRVSKISAIRPPTFRLRRLCILLEADNIVPDICDTELTEVINQMVSLRDNWIDTGGEPYQIGRQFEYVPYLFDILEGTPCIGESQTVMPTESSFDIAHSENCKVLPPVFVSAFVEAQDSFEQGTVDLNRLLSQDEFGSELNNYCQNRVNELQEEHGAEINGLPALNINNYRQIFLEGGIPEELEFALPATLFESESLQLHPLHLYDDGDNNFFSELNELEQNVLNRLRNRDDFVCWYRNPTNQTWGLRIPYRSDRRDPYEFGTSHGKYPDFLVVRNVDDSNVIDIIEPHGGHLEDWLHIASGFSFFAEQHGNHFGRIIMCCEIDNQLAFADFNREDVRSIVNDMITFEDFWRQVNAL